MSLVHGIIEDLPFNEHRPTPSTFVHNAVNALHIVVPTNSVHNLYI